MAESSNSFHDAARIEELEYIQVSHAVVSKFVMVQLLDKNNYNIWKDQMLCLTKSYQVCGIIEDGHEWPGNKSAKIVGLYESLVKGWIFVTLNQEVLKLVIDCRHPREIWKKLASFYGPQAGSGSPSEPSREHVTEIIVDNNKSNDKNDPYLQKMWRNFTLERPWWRAKAILKKHNDAVVQEINDSGDTMLHLAVREGNNYFVEKLLNFLQDDGEQIEKQNIFGETALHTAAIVDNSYAAELLFKKRKQLLDISDKHKNVPLLSAYHNRRLKTFLCLLDATKNEQGYLCSHLELGVRLLTSTSSTKQYDLALKLVKIYPSLISHLAKRDDQVLMALTRNFPSKLGFWEALIHLSWIGFHQKIVKRSALLFNSFKFLNKKAEHILWAMRSFKMTYYSCLLPELVLLLLVPVAAFYIVYQLICLIIVVLLYPFFILYAYLWKVLASLVPPIKHIEDKKKKYKEAKEILMVICHAINSKLNLYTRPFLEAIRLDASEVFYQLLNVYPQLLNCRSERNHDVFQLAVTNRSTEVYNLLSPMIKHHDDHKTMVDGSLNNLVHMAGILPPSFALSRTRGAALQLQRELQWSEEVEKLVLPTDHTKENLYGETPEMIFIREHADMVKEGEKWMKTTAESCSITAALIVTIVFAAAITVPGGSNQETGIPLFRKEIAFTIFAVCDAISLFTAATALLVFLPILITRCAEEDFLVILPRRLIFGLCALFVSTTAMMIAFGAILFLVFSDQRKWMLVPIGLSACLPISTTVTLQLPLVVELIQSTYFTIFGPKEKHGSSSSFAKRCFSLELKLK